MILIKDIILIQDKGRGVTILDRIDYIEKCVLILNTSQFRKLNTDLTKRLEEKYSEHYEKNMNLKTLSINGYTKPTGDRDCFMLHQKYINYHSVKSVCIRSYSGPYFPAFGPE